MILCYDLERRLPTYDFFFWAMHAKMLGASEITLTEPGTHVGWRIRAWPNYLAEIRRRRDHYMLTAGPLLGLPVRLGEDGDRTQGSHWLFDIWATAISKHSRRVAKMRSPSAFAGKRYSVTLRRHFNKSERNSEDSVWRSFAAEIGAIVIEDHDDAPLSLAERMAIYAGCEMNFGVPTGPFSILYFTDYPFMEWCDPANVTLVKDFSRHRIAPLQQVPWLNPDQRLVWLQPTLPRLMLVLKDFERRSKDGKIDEARRRRTVRGAE